MQVTIKAFFFNTAKRTREHSTNYILLPRVAQQTFKGGDLRIFGNEKLSFPLFFTQYCLVIFVM